jgi:hypothetical protein
MKRFLSFVTVCAIALSISFSANAQVKFGVKGGLNITDLSGSAVEDVKSALSTYTGFHAGVALQVGLPFGLAIQPEVLYSQSGVKLSKDLVPSIGNLGDVLAKLSVGSIQVPVAIQWGVKLGPVRPFVQAVPYVSFPVVTKLDLSALNMNVNENLNKVFGSMDYGVGLGAGVDIWKLQASVKYNWALGKLVDAADLGAGEVVVKEILDEIKGAKLAGLEVSVALFF